MLQRLRTASLLLLVLTMGIWSTAAAQGSCNCNTVQDFLNDPHIIVRANPDSSHAWYVDLGESTVLDGQYIHVWFAVEEGASGSGGHSSVVGPVADPFPAYPTLTLADFRFNLHYDQVAPFQVSISTTAGGVGPRSPGLPFGEYHAVFQRVGQTVAFTLYNAASAPVFTDTRAYSWPAFSMFELCYDYYTGDHGMCAWNSTQHRVDFISDRGPNYYRYLKGWIGSISVGCELPTPTVEATWGGVKSLYRP